MSEHTEIARGVRDGEPDRAEQLMRRQVLDRMIDDLVIEQASRGMGLYAGDELVRQTILQFSAFQKDGQFNHDAYERALRLQGYLSPGQFEERVRQSLITSQLGSAVRSTEFATPTELEELVRLQKQQRDFSYLVVPAAEFRSDAAPEPAEAETYYEEHKARFRTPERVKVDDARKFVGFEAYAQAIDCDVDMVILATPPGFRPMHRTT